MSELRVALVAEGPTDRVVVEAALKALLPRPFTLAVLQPEATRPQLGTGWCGVLKWCREAAARGAEDLERDATLPGFDLFVIHVDADVAEASYGDGGHALEATAAAASLPALPCSQPCPPPALAVDAIRARVQAWLGLERTGPRTVLCVPSKATEAWLAAAVLPEADRLRDGLECNLQIGARLDAKRIRKTVRDYRSHAATLTARWRAVTAACSQAQRFEDDVAGAIGAGAAIPPLGPSSDDAGPSDDS